VTTTRLGLTRSQILAFRRHVGALDERLPRAGASLRWAAWAGLQDSMPRAALLSIHARVEGTEPSTWEDPSLVQVWGPRFSAYVVAAPDRAVFTLGRLPSDAEGRSIAKDLADRLEAFLDGRRVTYGEAGRGLGVNPNRLRYAAPTGRVVLRWDGARQPTVWMVPAPDVDPAAALLELARRYLHVFGPGAPAAFAEWAGIAPARGRAAFEALADELVPVGTPIGDAWILESDEPAFRAHEGPPAAARLLPSGDAWFLLQGLDRELLVPDAGRRSELWTSRVWPGSVLVAGEVVGTWRRAQARLSISPWRALSPRERTAVEAEAASLPLPGIEGEIAVRWDG
jgi:DNA glycosylase AlkZ-like